MVSMVAPASTVSPADTLTVTTPADGAVTWSGLAQSALSAAGTSLAMLGIMRSASVPTQVVLADNTIHDSTKGLRRILSVVPIGNITCGPGTSHGLRLSFLKRSMPVSASLRSPTFSPDRVGAGTDPTTGRLTVGLSLLLGSPAGTQKAVRHRHDNAGIVQFRLCRGPSGVATYNDIRRLEMQRSVEQAGADSVVSLIGSSGE